VKGLACRFGIPKRALRLLKAFGLRRRQLSPLYREALNLVIKLEEMALQGSLHAGIELFLFRDNFVTESVFEKGGA
jgi:hypothetical protein